MERFEKKYDGGNFDWKIRMLEIYFLTNGVWQKPINYVKSQTEKELCLGSEQLEMMLSRLFIRHATFIWDFFPLKRFEQKFAGI